MYTKPCIESLKDAVDIVDLIGSFVQLKGSGNVHKGLCPFHQEKSPSFTVSRATSHYHCFGCGAHGDPIAFMMNYQHLTFVESIELLASKYNVTLEEENSKGPAGPSKSAGRIANHKLAQFFTEYLLFADEATAARDYLFDRGMDLDFIKLFSVGLWPSSFELFARTCDKIGITPQQRDELGLHSNGRPLLPGRIVFPIKDRLGHYVGFSGRKYREEAGGPKYINTPETYLFKKSHILYGLDVARKRIAKEKKALLVEGQIDALRLIQEGFTSTVSGQGTAFTEDMRKILVDLGVETMYLALDGDAAGRAATEKIGNMFQKVGVEVLVVPFSEQEDPDIVLKSEGPEGMLTRIQRAESYLSFIVSEKTKSVNLRSPAEKNQVVLKLAEQISAWDHPLMVHESLRRLADLTGVPEQLLGLKEQVTMRTLYLARGKTDTRVAIDPNRVLETDLLRWLFFSGEHEEAVQNIIFNNISEEHFTIEECRRIFSHFKMRVESEEETDLLSFGASLPNEDDQLFLSELTARKVNAEKSVEGAEAAVLKLLERKWFTEREVIRVKLQNAHLPEYEALTLAKAFDELKKNPPEVVLPA